MSSTLQDLSTRVQERRYSGECDEFRSFVHELLAIPVVDRRANAEDFYDTVERVMDGLFDHYCGGTLSESEKHAIFQLITDDWSDEAPGGIRASMVVALCALQPLAGVSEWLLEVARRQTDEEYALYLRSCAVCKRTKPAV